MPVRREGSETLAGGVVNTLPPHQIGLGEAASAENLDPRDLRGATTRNGRSNFSVTGASNTGVKGIKAWTRNLGTSYVVARIATTFYGVSAASWASIGIGGTNDAYMRATPMDNLLVIVVDGLVPKYWDATTFASLGGTPPSEAKYAATYVSKIWLAGDDSNPQTLSFSATNNAQDWTAVNDAGSITTQEGGGDTIQGLVAMRQALIVLYRFYADILTGDSVFNFRVDRLIDKGLVSTTGYVSSGEVAFFASDDAIYMVAGGRISDLTTLKIRESYRNISDKSKITLGIKGDLLIVTDYGADKGWACAYKYNRWYEWTGQIWECIDTGNDQTVYAGTDSGSTAQIWNLDTGSLDGTATITAFIKTGGLSFGWPDCPKVLRRVNCHAKPGIPTITLSYYKDGASTGSTNALATTAATGDDSWVGVHGQSAIRGRQLAVKMQWTGQGTLYGYVCYAEVQADEGEVPQEL